MAEPPPADPDHLYTALEPLLLELLQESPDGLGEHQLLEGLAARGRADFGREARAAALGLFQVHFLLFHLLYRLRDRLRGEARGELNIDCLCIRLDPPLAPGGSGLPAPADPLRAYYLELANLHETGEAEVEALLADFWLRYGRRDRRAEALAVLGLSDPVDDTQVVHAYRRLAMEHHPDRGGDKARLQAINAAMAALKGGG